MPIVQLPDGKKVAFPDGMTELEMSDAIASNFPELAAQEDKPFSDDAAEVGRQLAIASPLRLAEMAGKSGQAIGGALDAPEYLRKLAGRESGLTSAAKDVRGWAEEKLKGVEPDLEGRGIIAESLIKGASQVAPSLAVVGAYANPFGAALGPATTVALFGPSSYTDTKEKVEKETGTSGDAAGLISGSIQSLGELAANRFTLGMFGIAKPAAKAGMDALLGRAVDTSILKPAAKAFGSAMVGEPLTENIQDIGSELTERYFGTKPQDLLELAKETTLTTIGMTAILAPFGLAGHYKNSVRAKAIDDVLSNPEVPQGERKAVVDMLHKEGVAAKAKDANEWYAGATNDIANNLPVRRSADASITDGGDADQALGEAVAAAAKFRQQFGQQPATPPQATPADILNAETVDDAITAFNSSTPTGFGQVDEFANFLQQEKADIAAKRGLIAQRQSAMRESSLESADARVAGQRIAETRTRRLSLLDEVYASGDRTPGMTFLKRLETEYPNQPIPTPEEKAIIANRESAYQGFTQPDIEPSLPNELVMPEPSKPSEGQKFDRSKLIRKLLAVKGNRVKGDAIVNKDGKPILKSVTQDELTGAQQYGQAPQVPAAGLDTGITPVAERAEPAGILVPDGLIGSAAQPVAVAGQDRVVPLPGVGDEALATPELPAPQPTQGERDALQKQEAQAAEAVIEPAPLPEAVTTSTKSITKHADGKSLVATGIDQPRLSAAVEKINKHIHDEATKKAGEPIKKSRIIQLDITVGSDGVAIIRASKENNQVAVPPVRAMMLRAALKVAREKAAPKAEMQAEETALRARARELGIKNAKFAKAEILPAMIEKREAEISKLKAEIAKQTDIAEDSVFPRQVRDTARKNAATAQAKLDALVAPGVTERVSEIDLIAESSHKDAGEEAEAATPSVIAESLNAGDEKSKLTLAQMKEKLLGDIDAALSSVKPTSEHVEYIALRDARDKPKISVRNNKGQAEQKAFDEKAPSLREVIGFSTFDVPGDGVFKVLNTTENLTRFRDEVRRTQGFKKPAGQPRPETRPPLERPVSQGNPETYVKQALNDNHATAEDLQNAIEVARDNNIDDAELVAKHGELAVMEANVQRLNLDTWGMTHKQIKEAIANPLTAKKTFDSGYSENKQDAAKPVGDMLSQPQKPAAPEKPLHEIKVIAWAINLKDSKGTPVFEIPPLQKRVEFRVAADEAVAELDADISKLEKMRVCLNG